MNLHSTLRIYAEGNSNSGCNPAAARRAGNVCGRPPKAGGKGGWLNRFARSPKTAKERKVAKKAVEVLKKQPFDQRILGPELVLRHEAKGSSPLDVARYFSEKFFPKGKSGLVVYPGGNHKDVIHELGHHVDYTWFFDNKTIDSHKDKIDTTKAKSLIKGMTKEWEAERKRVMALKAKKPKVGEKAITEWFTRNWQKLKPGTLKAPSSLALTRIEEWFADAFLMYFTNNPLLRKRAPVTHGAMKQILRGRLFK